MTLLRQLFGPSRDEVWRRLAREVGGDFSTGGFFRSARVDVHVKPWTITLDTVSNGKVVFTRMRAPYVNPDGFRFTVYRRGVFSDVGKLLGMQDVEIGDLQFDRDFIIKGNDPAKLRALFANARIRGLIDAQRDVHLAVRDDEGWFGATFPEGVDELRFLDAGIIKDVDRLKQLYELFAEVLHHLCHIGSAYENDPNVSIR